MSRINSLLNENIVDVSATKDTLTFKTSKGVTVEFYHEQNCCEDVHIEDICGDLNDLKGTLLVAEEVSSEEVQSLTQETAEGDDIKWTFYIFATIKGSVTVRWYGSSNGYYSTEVNVKVSQQDCGTLSN
jgi:hypothetical protein